MRSGDHEDWEDDEPPMLGETNKLDEDNQAADESTKPPDASIMDEMVAVAQRAKEDKRKQQDTERNHKSFGQGLKKGFFNAAKPAKKKKAASAHSPSMLEPTRQPARNERLLIVKEEQEEAATASPTFVFPEVQEAMKSMNQLDSKEWMNERFFEKLARNPKLAQALQNPAFTKAIAEMQQDPQAAVLKYQKDPAVSTMLRDFMEFLGNHFEELGASEEAAAPKKSSTKHQQQVGKEFHLDNNQTPSAASKPPTIVDLDETRRQAIAGMQRTPEEEEQVQRIAKHPELLAALSDGTLMQRLHACQKSPGELQRLAHDPVLGPKLRLLLFSDPHYWWINMAELKDQVEAEMTRYRALQDEVQVLAAQRQTYAQQANENDMVKKELDLLDDEAKVYKLVGPVLLKQDVDEAKTNVNKRLEFINNELSKVNAKIEAKEKEAIGIRTNISNKQMEMQKRAAEAAKGAVVTH
ncbi:hypothetical protein PF003_g39240 [Phytophthora fragariae]|nr:hypothetical protein PF003_g39240 [Phytophthora fragariae]